MSQPLPTPRLTPLLRAGEQTQYISLDLIDAAPGAVIELAPGNERLVVIMSGRAQVIVDGREAGAAGGRADVFEGPGDALFLTPETAAELVADQTSDLSVVVAAVPPGAAPPGQARIIRAESQVSATVGRETWRRTVRTILGPADQASRLLVGETINDPGLWSSFPPHRHDRDAADEVRLEEVYLFRLQPANGFGVQVRYDTDTEQEARMVRDGEVAVIASGFHPVVAAPGHRLYYLWIMAGEGRELRPYFDPRYRWVEDNR